MSPAGTLTAREAEVLALLQRRLTNAEIAEQLFVSVRTVDTHVTSVLRKLGAGNREALASIGPRATWSGVLADALGVEGEASRSNVEVAVHLADRSVLIVLDNCEREIDAAAELVDAACASGGS